MKLLSLTAALLAVWLAGCGTPGPREAQWRAAASSALDEYIRSRLEGRELAASRALENALERMRDGADLDGLHTVLLASCAMDVALFLEGACDDFSKRSDGARLEALAYRDWLVGTLPAAHVMHLPERYRAIAGAIGGSHQTTVTSALNALTDPVSRMVATGVARRQGLLEDTALANSAQAARVQGWRAAYRVYENARLILLEKSGRQAEALALRQRLNALYDSQPTDAPR